MIPIVENHTPQALPSLCSQDLAGQWDEHCCGRFDKPPVTHPDSLGCLWVLFASACHAFCDYVASVPRKVSPRRPQRSRDWSKPKK
eukprot:605620-Rhodomonas_salina.1